jgi:hypothetical protein
MKKHFEHDLMARCVCVCKVEMHNQQCNSQYSRAVQGAVPPAFLHKLPIQLPPALAQAVAVAAAVEAPAGQARVGHGMARSGGWVLAVQGKSGGKGSGG